MEIDGAVNGAASRRLDSTLICVAAIEHSTPRPAPVDCRGMKTIRPRDGLVAFVLIAFSLCARADTAPAGAWKTFRDPAGHFSILMPDAPVCQTTSEPAKGNSPSSQSSLYMAKDSGGNIYLAGATFYDPAAKMDVDGELAADRDNFNNGIGAKTVSQQRLKFAGYPALKFISTNEQAKLTLSALVVLAGNDCYMIVAAYHGESEPPDAVRFFDSYKLLSP